MKLFFCVSLFLFSAALSPAAIHPAMADFNHDGKVDLADLAEFASAWLWQSSCDTAVTVALNVHYIGSTDSSYWYSFAPAMTVSYYFNLCTIPDGYSLYIWDACDGFLLDETNGSCWTVEPLIEGEIYYLEVRKTGTPTDNYDLMVTLAEE